MFEQVQPVIGPYAPPSAACRDYDPRAADVAWQIASLVRPHLPSIRVEHVGSTSVPGCAGKGTVDLMVAVPDGAMDSLEELLVRLGFQQQTGPDPFPETRPMLTGSWLHDNEPFQLHIHLIPEASPEADEMRFFRACLRADPELVKAYVAQKRKIIASGATDPLEYCRMKGEFIKQVLG